MGIWADNYLLLVTGSPGRTPIRLGTVLRQVQEFVRLFNVLFVCVF